MNIRLQKKSIWARIHIDPLFMLIIFSLLAYSIIIIWSASGQDLDIMEHKITQIFVGLAIMMVISQIPPYIYENLAPCLYILCIISLIIVDIYGHISKGARRWFEFGIIHFQPSEIAKIIVPLMVATFINRDVYPPRFKNITIAFVMIFVPVLLVAIQPDLGTAILIITSGLFILFLSGISWKLIGALGLMFIAFIPMMWFFIMSNYQRNRVMMLFNSTMDPLGAGYHIIQSKIAIGSGGIFGKGWLHGTQSQLEFLPERRTDFIFSVLAEELGLVGVISILILYLLLIIRGLIIAVKIPNKFGRVMVANLTLVLFVYIFVNIGMVSGILPVVGVPLPLISYGGSALIVLMAGFGMIMSIYTH
ncbi:peptidoglycan glycosyltransferase MrdB [Pantoea sp. Mhis]|uniref:peptidoglycan glycosyltransferase MrdB n=1 Tax=Pantoea sp. Mhis TaxID=2576759 RepID=UPI001357A8D7|nr:peptidoglycan glycosyltransferase MrdB [Pantoea sp. Mhis]MXP56267.1 peptidoglycan glycosyltransferase MrdB [Pantoea sp. Mhis]